MALVMIEGNLRHLPLNEVFQIIVTGQKSGILSLTKRDKRARIYFEFGRVQYAYSVPGTHLGELFVRAEQLTTYETQIIQDQLSDPSANLGIQAVGLGYISEKKFKSTLKVYITDMLTDLLSWKGGSFHFAERSNLLSQVPPEYTFDAMALLMEVIRRQDEWERGLADPRNVYKRSGDPSHIELPEGAWDVLRLLDGKRSASSVAADMDIPDQQVYRLLELLNAEKIISLSPYSVEEPLIFVISQDQLRQRLIQLSLRRDGMYPFLSSNYEHALEKLQSIYPKVIVLEKEGEESWEFIKEVRQQPGYSHLPVIMLEKEVESVGLLKRWKRPKVHRLLLPFQELELQELVSQCAGRPAL